MSHGQHKLVLIDQHHWLLTFFAPKISLEGSHVWVEVKSDIKSAWENFVKDRVRNLLCNKQFWVDGFQNLGIESELISAYPVQNLKSFLVLHGVPSRIWGKSICIWRLIVAVEFARLHLDEFCHFHISYFQDLMLTFVTQKSESFLIELLPLSIAIIAVHNGQTVKLGVVVFQSCHQIFDTSSQSHFAHFINERIKHWNWTKVVWLYFVQSIVCLEEHAWVCFGLYFCGIDAQSVL